MKQYKLYLVVFVVFISCTRATHSDEYIQTLQAEAAENPGDYFTVAKYVETVLCVEQNADKIDIDLIEGAIQAAEPNNEAYMQLALARLYFLSASYYNGKSNLMDATRNVQKGLILFTQLVDKYPNDVLIRNYRLINLMNLPRIFEQGNAIAKDMDFVFGKTEHPDLLIAVYKKGLDYYEDDESMKVRIEDALQELQAKHKQNSGEDSCKNVEVLRK